MVTIKELKELIYLMR